MPVSKTFQICLPKSAKVVRRRFHVPPPKKCEYPIFCNQKLTSQKLKLFWQVFFDNPTGEAFMYIMWKKPMFYLYSKWAFLAAKSKRAILCACTILCAMVDHLSEQNQAFWWFLSIFFPQNPIWKWECR